MGKRDRAVEIRSEVIALAKWAYAENIDLHDLFREGMLTDEKIKEWLLHRAKEEADRTGVDLSQFNQIEFITHEMGPRPEVEVKLIFKNLR